MAYCHTCTARILLLVVLSHVSARPPLSYVLSNIQRPNLQNSGQPVVWSPAVQHSSASQHVVLLQHSEGRCKSYDEGQEGRLHCAHVCLRYALSCVAAKAQHFCRTALHQPASPAAAWVLNSMNSIVLLLLVSLLIVIVNLTPFNCHVSKSTQHAAHHVSG